ncbi:MULTISPECIES: bifunctional GNAT family N-acetyltransferase/nucleoside diphosphate kinase regulator [unclassified Mesorhizobium]|uniref:bifunctional GNAT family N-acetyltransferase/nucleoside diphosphate kinase regulator n=1 Tax=unclassified Mesorhizobium TaxID=325217 RepID=UPI00086BCAD9|nr:MULTISPECIES: bifunctional GNAT family N-acetyltransferase/nucleoside diphosphate kinase regulator [unclassified Mesorhizobium]MBN9253665.1 GNAT family N-acetyltransferase [Mesorhizobium sp.]ODT14309.1 MAG: GNAT family N-acetyltransferase [Mesorhizobium sp. SCN 65-12]OJX77882.1 MAG: GNAT family N-acetyltransferase [Mesorhizobium sp. 65-26]
MKKPFVSLRPEITRSHAFILMNWMEDERVTRYLSDSGSVSRFIAQAVDRAQMPILTHLFNQGGRFFMAYDRNDTPVGFVRLVKTGAECEIVLVVGDHENWGQGLGGSTIREGLKLAFLDMRAEKVIARIHTNNMRSMKGFERCGFHLQGKTPTLNSLSMTADRYLQLLREGAMADSTEIYVTEIDKARLQSLMVFEEEVPMANLEHEIERAIVVEPQRVARDVVTMNSRVVLHIDGEKQEVALVYPRDADERDRKLSVFSDIGTAILGYQEGDAIDWMVTDRTRRILIEKMIYQPESSGDLHL